MQKDTWTIIGVMVTLVGLLATFMVTGLASIKSRLTAMDGRLHEMNTRLSRIEGYLGLPAEVEPIHFETMDDVEWSEGDRPPGQHPPGKVGPDFLRVALCWENRLYIAICPYTVGVLPIRNWRHSMAAEADFTSLDEPVYSVASEPWKAMSRMLDTPVESALDLARLNREGVSAESVDILLDRGFTRRELDWIAPSRTLSHRRHKGERLKAHETGRVSIRSSRRHPYDTRLFSRSNR